MLYIVISISISLKQVKFLVQNFLVKNWMIEGKEQFLGRDILARIIVVNIEIQWFPGKKKNHSRFKSNFKGTTQLSCLCAVPYKFCTLVKSLP